MTLNDSQKQIYNFYIKHLRKGQPYQPRKNFSDVDPNTVAFLHKIETFLKRYNHINWNDYFLAFNELHPSEKYPSLNYFTTRSALKTYALFQKQKENRDPEKQLDEIKNSLRFIGMFCLENKIFIEDYIYHKTGYMYSWLNHYREHRINPYSLMELGDFIKVLDKLPKDEIYLFANNLCENLVAFKTRYQQSIKTQHLTKTATDKVKNFVKNSLTLKQNMLI